MSADDLGFKEKEAPNDLGFVEHGTAMPGMAGSVSTIQEMPEDVSGYHRFVVKNFSNNPESSVKYLQERYPQYEIKHDDNNILFRKPGETSYKTLDPNLSLSEELHHPGEAVQDVGDVLWDIPAGLASTAASAAGGLAGGAATGGPGALPGAAAAGGATSAGLSLLRQKIGQALGIPQNIDKGEIALEGAGGAVAPLLFGTGATGAQAAKYAAEKGFGKLGFGEAAQEALKKSQRGVLSRGAYKIGSLASGTPAALIDKAGSELDTIKNLEKSPDPASTIADSVQGDVRKIAQAKTDIGTSMSAARKNSDARINLKNAMQPYVDQIDELEKQKASGYNTAANQEKIDALKSEFQRLFMSPEKIDTITGEPIRSQLGDVTAEQAHLLKQDLKDAADAANTGSKGIGIARNARSNPTDKIVEDTANSSMRNVSSDLEQSLPGYDKMTSDYADVSGLLKQLGPSTKTKDRAYNLVKNLSNNGANPIPGETLARIDQAYGTNFVDKANLVNAFNTFGKRGGDIIKSESRRHIPAAGVGAAAGGYAGYESGGGYKTGLAGATAGGTLGYLTGRPQGIRFYLEAANLANKSGLNNASRQSLLPLWNMMLNNQDQNQENQ